MEYTLGDKININTHLPQDKLEAIALLISGYTGNIATITANKSEPEPKIGEVAKSGKIILFPFPRNIDYEIKDDEIILSHALYPDMPIEEAIKDKTNPVLIISKVAKYIGNCDINITTEDGRVYEHRTAETENNIEEHSLRLKEMLYDPCVINADLFVSAKGYTKMFNTVDQRIYLDRVAKSTSNIQAANIGALCFYAGKDYNFTKEDVAAYVARINNASTKPITERMRLEGLVDFFKSEGLEDLAKYTEHLYNKQCYQEDIQRTVDTISRIFEIPISTFKAHNYKVVKKDTSDFSHNNDNEYEMYPFGSEQISCAIKSPSDVLFVYIQKNHQNEEVFRSDPGSLANALNHIKQPFFYEEIMSNIRGVLDKCPELMDEAYLGINQDVMDNLYDHMHQMYKAYEQEKLLVRANLTADRVYLDVPFAEKDEAKDRGAKWDVNAKSWYCKTGEESNFNEWLPDDKER